MVYLVVKLVYKINYRAIPLLCQYEYRALFYIFLVNIRKADMTMNPYEKIQDLSKKRGISVRELEKRLGFSNGYFSKWKKVSPNSDGLTKVADYFGVSVDYLLGREQSVKSQVADLKDDDIVFAFDGHEVSPEEKAMLRSVIEAYRKNKQ